MRRDAGFTLIEILIVMAILAVLLGISLINLGRPQAAANSGTTLQTLLSDLKAQQLMAMSGGTGGTASAQPYGIYVESGQFTLFAGSSYNAGDPNNFAEAAATGVTLSTTLSGSTVLFQKGTGEVQGYTAGSDTITVTGKDGAHVVTINRFGGLTVN
jgi:prepilin-type N-terminal cleavage/methylation domain-containing protein